MGGLATRLSRRIALATGGATLAGLGLRQTAAQQATPAATATPDKVVFMFVQVAQSGGIVPKDGEEGVYQVTLEGASAQTIYFSDRPERVVGDVPTDQFLKGLGFSPENPPNAALVTQTGQGENTLVVELFDPVWDEASGTLTYDLRVLDDYRGERLAHLAEKLSGAELPESFEHTSLFVDDCTSLSVCLNAGVQAIGPIPGGPYPTCWDPTMASCEPCGDITRSDLIVRCAEAYPDDSDGMGWTVR